MDQKTVETSVRIQHFLHEIFRLKQSPRSFVFSFLFNSFMPALCICNLLSCLSASSFYPLSQVKRCKRTATLKFDATYKRPSEECIVLFKLNVFICQKKLLRLIEISYLKGILRNTKEISLDEVQISS